MSVEFLHCRGYVSPVGHSSDDRGRSDHANQLHAYLDEVCETLPRWWTVRPYREWRRGGGRASAAIGVALAFIQCGGQVGLEGSPPSGGASSGGSSGSGAQPAGGSGGAGGGGGLVVVGGSGGVIIGGGSGGAGGSGGGLIEADCFNELDDDQDGRTDCADEDCQALSGSCTEGEEDFWACWDSIDNDGDGDRDCADWDCRDSCTPPYETRCLNPNDWMNNDGDDDLDGLIDCDDPDCTEICANPDMELACFNGEDDDRDGLYDQDDPDCELIHCVFGGDYAGIVLCEDCGNGRDDDNDGLVDCGDPNCFDQPACTGIENCYSGLDGDGDGLAQCDDPDCQWEFPCEPIYLYAAPLPIERDCAGGLDDDGDGVTDCADADCAGSPACSGAPGEGETATASPRRYPV